MTTAFTRVLWRDALTLLSILLWAVPSWAQTPDHTPLPVTAPSAGDAAAPHEQVERVSRDGVTAEFRIKTVSGLGTVNHDVFHGDYAEVSLT